jgi:hypothetical protein
MEENHKLTLYVSYYLSRFNDQALKNLGYRTWNEAFIDISQKLDVNEHSVKNWRDEFDPLHGHRAGWYQRPMSPSRVKVAKALEYLDEKEIRSIVVDIISGSIKEESDDLTQLTDLVTDKQLNTRNYGLRSHTGRLAEEYFISHHVRTSEPFKGELIDTRDKGCGYDFEIKSGKEIWFIEVKGLSEEGGGILFTSKEWDMARELKARYIVALVINVSANPSITFINSPHNNLHPQRNIVTTIQVQWSIPYNQIVK